MNNVRSLDEYRVAKAEKIIKERAKEDEKFSHVDDLFLKEHVEKGNVDLVALTKVVWHLCDNLNKLEQNLLDFKFDIIRLLKKGGEKA